MHADLITVILARGMLQRHPGKGIIYDLRSSKVVPEEILEMGGRPVRERVGHSFMKETMRRQDCIGGGELSGHFYFAENYFTDCGVLAAILPEPHVQVNSVHGQGVNRLAEGLRIEARAPDGLVEAFSVERATGFNLCVQWHPEWQAADNPVSVRLLRAFGDACRAYRDRPRAPQPASAR